MGSDFAGLMNGKCPAGAPDHHRYIAVVEMVYQLVLGDQPIYILYHPPSSTIFPCKDGGIIHIGKWIQIKLNAGHSSISSALKQISTHLFEDTTWPKTKHGAVPVTTTIYFLWNKNTLFIGTPYFVKEVGLDLQHPIDVKMEVISVNSDSKTDSNLDSNLLWRGPTACA